MSNNQNSDVSILFWLPRDNIGLRKEIFTLSKIFNKQFSIQSLVIHNSIYKILFLILSTKNFKNKQLFIYNISQLSFFISIISRICGYQVVQFLHEPGMINKLNYGFVRALKIYLVELLVSLSSFSASYLVVFSDNARKICNLKFPSKEIIQIAITPYTEITYSRFNTQKIFPLCYVGRIHPAKNFPLFIDIAKNIYNLYGHKSRVVSSDKEQLQFYKCFNFEFLDIVCFNNIPDKIIEDTFSISSVIFKLDKNMMQSGVVAQSHYFANICLVSNIVGFTQDKNELSHFIVDINASSLDLAKNVYLLHNKLLKCNKLSLFKEFSKIHNLKISKIQSLFSSLYNA